MEDSSLWAPWTASMLNDSVLESMKSLMKIRKYGKGQIIYCQGESSNVIYVLLDGIIEISVFNIQGRKRIINIHEAKCIFGETILAGKGYHNTAICLKPATVGMIDVSTIDWVEHNEFLSALLSSLCNKLIIASSQLKMHVEYDNIGDRVEGLLISLANQYGDVSNNEIKLKLPITHQMIADLLGSTRARVSQSFCSLRKKKDISIYKNKTERVYNKFL